MTEATYGHHVASALTLRDQAGTAYTIAAPGYESGLAVLIHSPTAIFCERGVIINPALCGWIKIIEH